MDPIRVSMKQAKAIESLVAQVGELQAALARGEKQNAAILTILKKSGKVGAKEIIEPEQGPESE